MLQKYIYCFAMKTTLLRDLLNLIYPELCVLCLEQLGKEEKFLCLACENRLPRYEEELLLGHPMEKALWGRIEVDFIWAFLSFRKGNATQKLLHEIKYRNQQDLARFLGQIMGIYLKKHPKFRSFDALIPVPLHPSKIAVRGYNQSLLLAEGISEACKIPVIKDVLIRQGKSETQTQKNRSQRWENVSADFRLIEGSEPILTGKSILLVDDVFTTGATSEACLHGLKVAGAKNLSVACLAFAR